MAHLIKKNDKAISNSIVLRKRQYLLMIDQTLLRSFKFSILW